MRYIINAIRREVKPTTTGGTWTKIEVKTDKTGDDILELGLGISEYKRNNIKEGDMIEGYIEKKAWNKIDGTFGGYNTRLNGITVDYLYALMKKYHPEIDAEDLTKFEPEKEVQETGWNNSPAF